MASYNRCRKCHVMIPRNSLTTMCRHCMLATQAELIRRAATRGERVKYNYEYVRDSAEQEKLPIRVITFE